MMFPYHLHCKGKQTNECQPSEIWNDQKKQQPTVNSLKLKLVPLPNKEQHLQF